MAKKIITIIFFDISPSPIFKSTTNYQLANDHDIFFISVDIDNYHDKCQIFIFFKFKARFLLQSELFLNFS